MSCDPENVDFVWEGMHGFAFRPFQRSVDFGVIGGAKMTPFGSILVAEMTSKKQAISRRARGVPWEGSWGVPCGTRGFRGEPRSERTCPCGGISTFWPLGWVARIATIKTIAAYESQRIMPMMPNWETGKVYEA